MTRHRHRPRAKRAGFTIIEIMVAVVILSIGILGLAATAAVVTRQMTGAVHQNVAANVAYSRMERIRTGNCVAMLDSSSTTPVTTRNVSESWVVQRLDNAIGVDLTITYKVRGQQRKQFYHSEFPCTPL
ncbi:MAG TPA: prepilin-type N-terminal cleavage/methylation domain-containing protein [Gemmatimonadaceae bacterium]|nr:prepilin-type N-terminal cleavage/methylation domain-containing protein [Gemmatimonadaceae bacterium]